ncbi:hypothetical protein [Prochlorococcus sp. MIT 1223]|uniref:hypothetical protein n=1 Tax=Prochlorococcus sp. MIT 1223 TaxID=3096217 RepID=UPI002A75E452|nr:hypothetical protein [Prochlorococcus sp. MIT 1223]
MNSILKQELLELKGTTNYWLSIGWILAIIMALVSIAIVIVRKSVMENSTQEVKVKPLETKGKGFTEL